MKPSPDLSEGKKEEFDFSVSATIFNIPRSHYHCTFDNFDWQSTAVKKAVVKFLERLKNGEKSNLLFTGVTGLGKTHLGVAIYRWGVLRWGTMLCNLVQVGFFAEEVKKTFNRKDESDSELFQEVEDAKKLLVLDDPFGRQLSTWEADNILFRLINIGYTNGSSTVITSNLTLDELSGILRPHEMSRLLDNSVHIEFTGKDRRLKKI